MTIKHRVRTVYPTQGLNEEMALKIKFYNFFDAEKLQNCKDIQI